MVASLCGRGRTAGFASDCIKRRSRHPSVTFVKPGLLKTSGIPGRAGRGIRVPPISAMMWFNEVGWFDPTGQLVRLVEARTFLAEQSAS